jgi:phosphatidylethanolamine/phosphatidyl-N-methylethanolamine N-methyltransferase
VRRACEFVTHSYFNASDMQRRFTEHALFFREFLRNFHTTGAIFPSGRHLAAALARFVGTKSPQPRRILEVGPGTGAVTQRIIAVLAPTDRLDLVELNDTFVDRLNRRFVAEPAFQAVADRARVLHCPVEDLPRSDRYDLIVSGLPLNNFAAADVERILATLAELLAPGGTLSFFEYIAVRSARTLISGKTERARLRGIGKALHAVLDGREIRREAVWLNVPPAWVHHVRI